MPREEQTIGGCPQCESGAYTCKYNRFESDDLRIDSWEHKCPDCGHRETTAFRSDDEEANPDQDTLLCPYCERKATI